MRRFVFLAFLICSTIISTHAQVNTITTVAGGGTNTTAAASAYLPGAFGVVWDKTTGNTYVSATSSSIVYKVDSSGNITPYAGTGIIGFSGDNGPATSAQLDSPYGLAVDGSGNLFIADAQNNRIREVATNGIITTVAGSGTQYNGIGFFGGNTGDGGPATGALLNFPQGVAVDANGNFFIADAANNLIRKVDNSSQHIITTYAGGAARVCANATDGVGDGCPATDAIIAALTGVAVDSLGNVYIADTGAGLVRKVNTASPPVITAYAGTLANACDGTLGDGGLATSASLCGPSGVFITAGDIVYIADTYYNRVREVNNANPPIISTIAGSSGQCLTRIGCGDGGSPTAATLNSPSAVGVNGAGSVLIGDPGINRFRIVTTGASPTINNFAGSGIGGDTGLATNALIGQPYQTATDSSGDLFLFDSGGARLRRVNVTTQNITDFAGNGAVSIPGLPDGDGGAALSATFSGTVLGMWLDKPTGNLYFADAGNSLVRVFDQSNGNINVVAGRDGQACSSAQDLPGCGDNGPATSAFMQAASGVATDSHGNVYIADGRLNRIRVVCVASCPVATEVAGNIYNFAGTGMVGPPTNGTALTATLNQPFGITFDSNDNLYFADSGNNVIRMIDTSGNITTVAFNGQPTFGGDGGSALSASMQFPQQVALDGNGNLFVGGGLDNVVRRIDAGAQTVTTVAGDIHNLDGGFNGDGIAPTQALISNFGLTIVTNAGTGLNTLYIADAGNNRIRAVTLAPVANVTPSAFQNFGAVLQGTTGTLQALIITNTGLDDLLVQNVTATAGFTPLNGCPAQVPPGGLCEIDVTLAPTAAQAAGAINGTLSFTTSDSTVTKMFALTGTVATIPETLTLSVAGSGTGIVDGNVEGLDLVSGLPVGIICPAQMGVGECKVNLAMNEQVTLTAIGTGGSAFAGWLVNGAASASCPDTTPSCTVTMNAAQAVTASFGPATITISAMGNGSGTLTINPGGTVCTVTNGVISPSPCTATGFPTGTTTVTITAAATGASTFAGWLGFCSLTGISLAGTGPCNLPLSIEGITALNGALVTGVFSVAPQKFGQGDVFVGTVDGMIFEYTHSGTLVQVLNSGDLGGIIAGMNFDSNGNLYAANPVAAIASDATGVSGTVEVFGSNGASPTGSIFSSENYNSSPLGVLIDPAGDVFVGQSSGQNTLLEFASNQGVLPSTPSITFFPAYESATVGVSTIGGGIGYLELLDDEASVLYSTQSAGTAELGTVKNFDILNNHQNPDFATGLTGGPAFAIRELGDGSVLVANTTQIVRLSRTGSTVMQTYKPGGAGLFYALNLDPGGTSFWTGDALSGKVYQVNISDGSIATTITTGLGFNTNTVSFSTIFGIAVVGQPASGGADLAVNMTGPTTDSVNTNLTYSISVTNNGPLNATNTTVTDALPAGLTFVSSATTVGSCVGTTTVTCSLGTLKANATAVTISIVVTPTVVGTGTLTNTVTVSSTSPDPNTANNSSTVSTTITGGTGANLVITKTAPATVAIGGTLTYTIVVTNNGPAAATGVTMTDPVPENLSPGMVVASEVCTRIMQLEGPTTLSCAIGNLANGASTTIMFNVAPTTAGPISNTATVTGTNNTNTTTNSATATTTVGSSTTGPVFSSTTLSAGAVGVSYGTDIQVTGGTPPYTFAVATGSTLPPGFNLVATANGTVAAGHVYNDSPATASTLSFNVTVTDSSSPTPQTATGTISIPIGAAPPNTQASLLTGQYGLLERSYSESDGSEGGALGSLTFNGIGGANSITGVLDVNDPNQISQAVPVTGSYSIGPDNRGFASLTAPATACSSPPCTVSFAMAVGNVYRGIASTVEITQFNDDNGNDRIGSGILLRQDPTAFNTKTFTGTYAFGLGGQTPKIVRAAELGLITFTNINSALTVSGTANLNQGGTLDSVSLAGTFTAPDSNGRIVENVTPTGLGAGMVAIYQIDANEGFAMNLDSRTTNDILIGSGLRQAATPFGNGSLAGPDIITLGGTNTNGTSAAIGLLKATLTPSPTITITADTNDGGTLNLGQVLTGAYTIGTNGSGTFTSANGGLTFVLAQQDRGFAFADDTSVALGEFEPQVGAPFAAAPFTGNFFFGEEEALGASGSQISGNAALQSGTTSFNITGDESHSGGDLSFDETPGALSLTVNSSNGHFTTPANSAIIGITTGYLTSPFEFALLNTTSSHPSVIQAQSIKAPPGTPSPASTTVNFPTPVAIGSSAQSVPVTITNTGLGPLGISGTGVPPDFKFDPAGTCTAGTVILQPGGTCTIVIDFAPSASAQAGAQLSETLTATTDGTSNINITATGTVAAVTTPDFTLSATPPTQTVIAGASTTYTVNAAALNQFTGSVALTVSGLPTGATGTFNPTPITPGTPSTLTVTTAVTAPSSTSTLTITGTSGTLTHTATVQLTVNAPVPLILISPGTLTFGATLVNTTSTSQPVTISVSANSPASLTVQSITPPAGFTQSGGSCMNGPTSPGNSCTINVFFAPTTTGTITGNLMIKDNAAGSPQMVMLSGISVSGNFTVLPSSLNFGSVTINTMSAPQPVTVSNGMTANVMINSITTPAGFAQTSNCLSAPLAPNGTCTINVTFTPTGPTTFSGNLEVLDSISAPPPTVALTGTGVNVPFILTYVPPSGGSPNTPLPVSPGGQLAVPLLLSPIPGVPPPTVQLTCTSSAPQFITCAPAPNKITLTLNGSQVAIVVNTFCQGATPVNDPVNGPGGLERPWELLLATLAMIGIALAYRRRSRWALSFAALLLITLGSAACSSLPKGPAGQATPPGPYTLFITATANGASTTVQVPILVVQ